MRTFNQFLDEGVLTSIGRKKPEKKAQKAKDAGARARRKVARRVHAKYVSGSEDLVPDSIREGLVDLVKKGAKRHAKAVEKKKIKNRKAVPYAALAAQHEPEGELVEGDVHSGQGEKIQKRTKAWMDKKGQKGAPGLDAMKARTAEHKAKRGVKEEIVTEADPRLAIYQSGMTDASRVKGRVGKAVDKVKDKVKKVLGKKDKVSSHLDRYRFQSGLDNYLKSKVKKEDKAFDYVVAKLRKQHGDGVLTKGDKMPEPSAAQKKKNAEIRAQRAKEDHRDETEKATSGRYNDRSRSD